MKWLPRDARVDEIFRSNLTVDRQKTDRLFLYLLLAQWALAIVLALVVSPYAWTGRVRTIHFHVEMALLLGAALNALPIVLIRLRPGDALTRHVVALTQMLWSALLIHLTGGRIETHFHIFGSLAFLAFYRDWRILLTATLVIAGDHLLRGLIWPESIYGIVNPEWWRFLEDAGWVAFEDIVLVYGCIRGINELRANAEREDELERVNTTIETEVRDKTAELKANMQRYKQLVESTSAIPWEMDSRTQALSYISPQVTRVLGIEVGELSGDGSMFNFVHADDRERVRKGMADLAASHDRQDLDIGYRVMASGGHAIHVRSIITSYRELDRPPVLRGITLDVTQQKKLEQELHQAQKLESVGRLAAGVAHEINTPIQFVSDSVHFLRDAIGDLSGLIAKYRGFRASVADGTCSADAVAEVTRAEQDGDIDYLLENVPKAIDRSLDGLSRVAVIVRSMKEFAHPDQKEMTPVDLNNAIESTLVIARHEYKYVAEVETDFGDIPMVNCLGGDVNQVILNIVVNAAHAIGDVVQGTEQTGRIVVRTRLDGDAVVISISDTGGGIPEHVRGRVFDPFFTTKDVGKGTGQGLAIARSVVEKHQGQLGFETELGKGTTFSIRLPIDGRGTAVPGVAA